MYKILIKPFLFLFNPEKAHYITVKLLHFVTGLPFGKAIMKGCFLIESPKLHTHIFGLDFPNPVGLAAGFDKDGKYISEMESLGFGFIEVGTVTPKPQSGNPKPRLFRLPKDNGIINRMGFNNEGVEALVHQLKSRNSKIIIGGNIGKNKDTPNDLATSDYDISFRALFPYVDYFVVNVSSPNTPDLRQLQDKEPLTNLLNHLQELNKTNLVPKPILLKIAPDLTTGQLDDIIEIVKTTGIAGVIATNTTISRANLKTSEVEIEAIANGGLSGKPLTDRSTEVIRYINEKSGGSIPIIGVGGIHSALDAEEKLKAGASLIQLYTGMIYEGPSLIKSINKHLLKIGYNSKLN